MPMQFAMMAAAQWNGKLVTYLAGQGAALRKTQVMRIRRKPAAHKARTSCYEPHVVAIANPLRFRQREHTLIDGFPVGPGLCFVKL